MNKKLGYQILELCGILLGNAILAFGIAAFVLPHGMITGGATGLGLVTSRVFGVDLSVAVAVYNIILFAVGAFVLGKKFALTTIVSTIVYPMFLSFFTQQQWIATAVGFVAAFFVAWAVIAFFMNYIRRKDFKLFGWYRIVLGIILILFYIFFRQAR